MWKRHTIVAGSSELKGADGVHLDENIDGDGQLAIVCGYEQGNKVTVSLRPKSLVKVKAPWPKVVLPINNLGPEDAVFGDVTRMGARTSSSAPRAASGWWSCSRPRTPTIYKSQTGGRAWTCA